ncbi:MAG: asparagine synthase [Rhodanobacter sp.]|nr:MAG: asparagine synthase [Rhodanobacter sp.]
MLNALSISLGVGDPVGRLRALRSFESQGFVAADTFIWKEGVLDTWADPAQSASENCSIRLPTGYACCVGPLWYRGRFGGEALDLLINEISEAGQMDEMELRGNFVLFLHTDRYCALMNDALGLVRLYASADKLFYSTSWLATCAYTGNVEIDEAAACEYVLLGASHSDRTVARGITTLPLGHAVDLAQKKTCPRLAANVWSGGGVPQSFDEAADEAEAMLHTVFTEIAAAFPGRLRAALSGGFDSRLILAALLACGTRPDLFVYGGQGSEDIPIARLVAGNAGISLRVIDKNVLNGCLALPDIERLVHSALFFDGLPNDGIYDRGADQQTRKEQTAGGCLALNGGGGEIFRNFFHLRDRRFYAIDVVRTFYRGFDPGVFRRPEGLPFYEDRLVSSIERSIGMENSTAHQRFGRQQVELIYPLFRCHHWMSVNNSIALRHGYYATPLVDLNTVRLAHRLPMAWKNAGRFESSLIARLHPGISNQSSTYGFRFADGPDLRARLREKATCMRPVFARPFINAARRRLRRAGVAPYLLKYCRSLLPGEWQLDPVLDLRRLPDDYAFARALAVEIAWRELVA